MNWNQLFTDLLPVASLVGSAIAITVFLSARQKLQFEAGKKDAKIEQMEKDIRYLFDRMTRIDDLEKSILELVYQVKHMGEKMIEIVDTLKEHKAEHLEAP